MLLMFGDGISKHDLWRCGAYFFYSGVDRPNDRRVDLYKRRFISVFKPLHAANDQEYDAEKFDLSDADAFEAFKKEIGWNVMVEHDEMALDDYEMKQT